MNLFIVYIFKTLNLHLFRTEFCVSYVSDCYQEVGVPWLEQVVSGLPLFIYLTSVQGAQLPHATFTWEEKKGVGLSLPYSTEVTLTSMRLLP